MSEWRFAAYWPRWHVSYLQAVGAHNILSRSGREVSCSFDPLEGTAFVFQGISADEAETFFRTEYKPIPAFSPWNGRSFGSGFAKSLASARGIPQLADYVAAVDACKPTKKKTGGEKHKLVHDLLSGEGAHAQWCHACWKATDGKLNARPLLGAGGCEASCDYGSLFLKAAVDWFESGPGASSHWTLGGFAFPDVTDLDWGFTPPHGGWMSRRALDVLLLIEGAAIFSAQGEGWHIRGPNRGRVFFPLWEGDVTWPQWRELITAGFLRRSALITPGRVTSLVAATWAKDGPQMLRMAKDGGIRPALHAQAVRLEVAFSPEERGWVACLFDADCDEPFWVSRPGAEAAVSREAREEAERLHGDRLELLLR